MTTVDRIQLTLDDATAHLYQLPHTMDKQLAPEEVETWDKWQQHLINFYAAPNKPSLGSGSGEFELDCNQVKLKFRKKYFDPICYEFELHLPAHPPITYTAYHSGAGAISFFLQVAHAVAFAKYDHDFQKQRKEAGYIHILELFTKLREGVLRSRSHIDWQDVITLICDNLASQNYCYFETVLVEQSTLQGAEKIDYQRATHMVNALPESLITDSSVVELGGEPTNLYSYCRAKAPFLDCFGMYVTPEGYKLLEVILELQVVEETTGGERVDADWSIIELHDAYQDTIAELDVVTWAEFEEIIAAYDNPLIRLLYEAIEVDEWNIPELVYLLLVWNYCPKDKTAIVAETIKDIYHKWLSNEVLAILNGQVILGETNLGHVIAASLPPELVSEVELFSGAYGEYLEVEALRSLIYDGWEAYEIEGLTKIKQWLREHLSQWVVTNALVVLEVEGFLNKSMIYRVYQQVGKPKPELSTPHPFGTFTNESYMQDHWNRVIGDVSRSITRAEKPGTYKVYLSYYLLDQVEFVGSVQYGFVASDVHDVYGTHEQYTMTLKTPNIPWKQFSGKTSYEKE